MEMTREHISFAFDPRDMLLSLQMGISFVRAAVACSILERTSGLEPSSETTAPRYLKLVTVPNFCPYTFISLWINFHILQKLQTLARVELFSSPIHTGRAIALPRCLCQRGNAKFYIKVFYVMGKALSGELSCMGTGLLIQGREYFLCSIY